MKRCPVCAELLADDLSICPFCGEPLNPSFSQSNAPAQPPSAGGGMVKCPICGELIEPNLSVCPICGENIGAPSSPLSESQSAPIESQSPPPIPVPPSIPEPEVHATADDAPLEGDASMRACPVCGEMIDSHRDICPMCFEPTGFGSATSEPAFEESSESGGMAAEATAIAAMGAAVSNPSFGSSAPPLQEEVIKPATKPNYTPNPEPVPQSAPETTAQFIPEPGLKPATPETSSRQASYPGQSGNDGRFSTSQSTVPPVTPVTPHNTPERKGGNLKWLLIALIALLALALGGTIYYFLSKDKDSDEGDTDNTETLNDNSTREQDGEGNAAFNDNSIPTDEDVDDNVDDAAGVNSVTDQMEQNQQGRSDISSPNSDKSSGYADAVRNDLPPSVSNRYKNQDRDRNVENPRQRRQTTAETSRTREPQGQDVAPPQSSGTGFTLQRVDGNNAPQRGNNNSNGSSFKLQEVDRIPNQ